jgi:hypothetical protein
MVQISSQMLPMAAAAAAAMHCTGLLRQWTAVCQPFNQILSGMSGKQHKGQL